jgi:hypothetical protein
METKQPSVQIVTPTTRGGIQPDYMLSVIDSLFYLTRHGVEGQFKIINSSWISNARNKAVKELSADFLMFVDSDMVFPHHAIAKLMLSGREIIGGLYYKKGEGSKPVAARLNEEGLFKSISDFPNEVFEVDAVGTGFLLIRKTVFDAFTQEKIKELGEPFNFLTLGSGKEESEDWAFCRRAKQLGFKIYCDPTIQLGHIGEQTYTREHYLAFKAYEENVAKSLKYHNNIPGWMTPIELNWLYETAQQMEDVVEIGSWKGRSTHALLSGCKGPVYAIDHFQGSVGEDEAHKEAKERDIYQEFMQNVGKFENLRVMKMSSLLAVKQFKDKSVDCVFLDGCHLYEEVAADIRAWLPKCKKMICGHDYNLAGVRQAVDELLGETDNAGSIWIKQL